MKEFLLKEIWILQKEVYTNKDRMEYLISSFQDKAVCCQKQNFFNFETIKPDDILKKKILRHIQNLTKESFSSKISQNSDVLTKPHKSDVPTKPDKTDVSTKPDNTITFQQNLTKQLCSRKTSQNSDVPTKTSQNSDVPTKHDVPTKLHKTFMFQQNLTKQ